MAEEKTKEKRGILERLASGHPVVGDGGFIWALEKRGYIQVGSWTPECTVEHPEAVRQLHREFLRAGADVMQAFTFWANDSRLEEHQTIPGEEINRAACRIAREVAEEGDALVAASLSMTASYKAGKGKQHVQAEFKKQLDLFVEEGVDFIICEYISYVEEMEWAIEVSKATGKPVAAMMVMGPGGDKAGISVGQCAIRMVQAGAEIVGQNCNFDPAACLEVLRLMKVDLDKEGLHPYLIVQPNIYKSPEISDRMGYLHFPEFPYALEPRVCTRFEIQKYARDAYNLGVHYIGGCCGFEPYHIRAIGEELHKERGKIPQVTREKGFVLDGLANSNNVHFKARGSRQFWDELKPATGRPESASYCQLVDY